MSDGVARLVKTHKEAELNFERLLQAYAHRHRESEGTENPFVPASVFWEESREVTWLVPDLIPWASLCLIAGKPKSGKTILALNLAVSLAVGGEFLGREVPKARAGVIQLEDPRTLVRKRLGLMVDQPPDRLFLSVGKPWFQGLRDRLFSYIYEYELNLLVIDPLVQWNPGARENSAEEMGALMYELRRLVQQTECSVLVVHHSRKGEGDHGDSIRGSSAILGAVDVALELVKEEEGRAHLRVISRFGSVEDEALELETETMTWRSLGCVHHVEGERRRGQIMEALEEMKEASASELMEVLDIPKRTLYRDLNALEHEGLVRSRTVTDGRGKPRRKYFVPEGNSDAAQNKMASEQENHPQEPILCQRADPYIVEDLAQNPEHQSGPMIIGNLEALEGQEWTEELL